jgi:hypothetical protein
VGADARDPAAEIAREVLRLHDGVLAERTLVGQVGAARRLADYCAGHGVEMARAYLALAEQEERDQGTSRDRAREVTPEQSEAFVREQFRIWRESSGVLRNRGAFVDAWAARAWAYELARERMGRELDKLQRRIGRQREANRKMRDALEASLSRERRLGEAALALVDGALDAGDYYEVPTELMDALAEPLLAARRRAGGGASEAEGGERA